MRRRCSAAVIGLALALHQAAIGTNTGIGATFLGASGGGGTTLEAASIPHISAEVHCQDCVLKLSKVHSPESLLSDKYSIIYGTVEMSGRFQHPIDSFLT